MRVKFTFHSFAVLRRIHSIRRSMAKLVARRFHDFDASGYGSATLAGLSNVLLDRLQSCTSRRLCHWSTSRPPLVMRSGENSVPSGSDINRFTLPACIAVYLSAELTRVADADSRWRRRSSNMAVLVIPRSKHSTIGDRAFPVATARVWNSLPLFVK